ncbi:hypothetical protein [Serratia rubidaea]|uniref:hypothetical protein n=1 Tax=Serratia rubidaea TaxID=61652 RepID=UPI00242FD739|nr:hypothetical protein [Serratia rubidaea]MCR0997653.1 hypothetical protein [Serratia rubidaea]
MHNSINKLLSEKKWPGINSVIFGDGRLVLLEAMFYTDSNYHIAPVLDSTIDSYLNYQADSLTIFDVFSRGRIGNFEVCVGDGSSEGEGVIYVVNSDDNQLCWFAFFENGGPFIKVDVDESGIISATSESNVIWELSISNPLDIKLTYNKNMGV